MRIKENISFIRIHNKRIKETKVDWLSAHMWMPVYLKV